MLNVVPKIVPMKSLVSLLNSDLGVYHVTFKIVVEGNVEVTQGAPATTLYVGLSMPRAWMLCLYRYMLEEHESLSQACCSLNEDLLTFLISYDCQVPANMMTESSALLLELQLNLRMHWFLPVILCGLSAQNCW
jgi:hypothetical protein